MAGGLGEILTTLSPIIVEKILTNPVGLWRVLNLAPEILRQDGTWTTPEMASELSDLYRGRNARNRALLEEFLLFSGNEDLLAKIQDQPDLVAILAHHGCHEVLPYDHPIRAIARSQNTVDRLFRGSGGVKLK
jgi:hypothetical protein